MNILGYKMEISKTKLRLHSEELAGRGGGRRREVEMFSVWGVTPALCLDIHPSHTPATRQFSTSICTTPVLQQCAQAPTALLQRHELMLRACFEAAVYYTA